MRRKTAAKLTMLEWQARNSAPVLIHCTAGQSRSAAIAAVVLMRMREVSLRDAFASLKACHPIAFPNYGLWSPSFSSQCVMFIKQTGRGCTRGLHCVSGRLRRPSRYLSTSCPVGGFAGGMIEAVSRQGSDCNEALTRSASFTCGVHWWSNRCDGGRCVMREKEKLWRGSSSIPQDALYDHEDVEFCVEEGDDEEDGSNWGAPP